MMEDSINEVFDKFNKFGPPMQVIDNKPFKITKYHCATILSYIIAMSNLIMLCFYTKKEYYNCYGVWVIIWSILFQIQLMQIGTFLTLIIHNKQMNDKPILNLIISILIVKIILVIAAIILFNLRNYVFSIPYLNIIIVSHAAFAIFILLMAALANETFKYMKTNIDQIMINTQGKKLMTGYGVAFGNPLLG
jgi:hypothetical protein